MSALLIRIKKRSDGNAALTCTRADGSTVWQRQTGSSGQFFPLHDLTHFAVETVLGAERAFYGLIASGWEFDDFRPPWPRGPLPAPALDVELIVGFLDAERSGGATWAAADLRDKGRIYYEAHALAAPPNAWSLSITDAELDTIRSVRGRLFAQWDAVAPGDALEVTFP